MNTSNAVRKNSRQGTIIKYDATADLYLVAWRDGSESFEESGILTEIHDEHIKPDTNKHFDRAVIWFTVIAFIIVAIVELNGLAV